MPTPTQTEMVLYSFLNQLEDLKRRKELALTGTRSESETIRKASWAKFDALAVERAALDEDLVTAWRAVKDGVVAKAVGNG